MARRDEQAAPPKRAYVHQAFPAWRYHPTKDSKMVADAKQMAEDTPDEDGWVGDPALLVAPPTDTQSAEQAGPDSATMRAAFEINWQQLMKEHRELQSRHDQAVFALTTAQGEADALRVASSSLRADLEAALRKADALQTSNTALKAELEALKSAAVPAPTQARGGVQFQKKAAPVVEPVTSEAKASE